MFAAYADFALRRRWFRMPGDPARSRHELDFRLGGHEVRRGVFAPTGVAGAEEADRVPLGVLGPRRRARGSSSGTLVTVDGVRRWASLVTVSLSALPPGDARATRRGRGCGTPSSTSYLAYAGDGAQDIAHLKGSTGLQLNGLAAALNAAG